MATFSKINEGATHMGGVVVQAVNVIDSTAATGTTTIPNDATIPQNTEGTEFMTLAITPTDASNILLIIYTIGITASTIANSSYWALFQDSTADALASVAVQDAANNQHTVTGMHYMVAGTVSSTTFKVRGGPSAAGTVTFNGAAGTDRHSTAGASSITITEIAV